MFLLGKDGKISVIRIGTLIAVVGVVFFIGAGIWFYFDQASRRSPLNITPYPQAERLGARPSGGTGQQVFYSVPLEGAPAEEVTAQVAAYYDDRLANFQRGIAEDQRVSCVRNPADGIFPDYVPGENLVPYEYGCMFDRSGFGTVQWTEVTIRPGLPEQDQQDVVVITYDQQWTR